MTPIYDEVVAVLGYDPLAPETPEPDPTVVGKDNHQDDQHQDTP